MLSILVSGAVALTANNSSRRRFAARLNSGVGRLAVGHASAPARVRAQARIAKALEFSLHRPQPNALISEPFALTLAGAARANAVYATPKRLVVAHRWSFGIVRVGAVKPRQRLGRVAGNSTAPGIAHTPSRHSRRKMNRDCRYSTS